MLSKDFKILLQQYASALFELHNAMQALRYSPAYYPAIRYDRGLNSPFEMYWCNENPPADLTIVWLNYSNSPVLRSNGASTLPIPEGIKAKALALLQELDSQRELVALYRCGYFEGDTFILSSWLIPFPSSYEPGKGDGSGVYYTVTREGVIGLATPYAESKKLCAALI